MITNNYSVTSTANSAPSFRGVNAIQISKKVFDGIDNLTLDTVTNKQSILRSCVKRAAGRGKTLSFLESPRYANTSKMLKKLGVNIEHSIESFSDYVGLPMRSKISPNADTFWVLTGKEKDAVSNILSAKTKAMTILGLRLVHPELTPLQLMARANIIIDDLALEKIVESSNFHKFKADSVSDVKNIVRSINYNV